MPAALPSASSGFIPDHDASNSMVTEYARNVNKFALLKYSQIVNAKKTLGYYLEMTVEEAGRILSSDLANFAWPDGDAAPVGNDGKESFNFKPFRTERYSFPVPLGDLTIEQASWDILAQHSRIKAQQAMTARTQLAVTALTTDANHLTSHILDVTAISGNTGSWSQSTTARQDIKRSLHTAMELILDDTLAAVSINDFQLVINSSLAAKLARTQEIVDYIKSSPDALAMVKGELSDPTGNGPLYGLPAKLYGFDLVVEATRKVTSRKGATRVTGQVMPEATPVICSRPGGLIGVSDAPNFSSLVGFFKEEMTVEKFNDAKNRRTEARVVENYAFYVVAPASTVKFKAAA